MTQPKILLEGIKKSFGKKDVLKGIDLSVKSGESVVILGGSGSGKSVLIKIISGLIQKNSGSIKIDGIELSDIPSDKLMQKIGFLFQGGALFDSLPIWQNVSFQMLHTKSLDKKKARELAIEKLKLVGLDERTADLYPDELSGGMKKRASLARAIAFNPEIIFFDEPTTGLDPIMSSVISNLIAQNSKKIGATTITITHDMSCAKTIADKVAMLYNGKIIWFDSAEKIFDSGNEYLDQFVNGRIDGPISTSTS